MRTQIGGRDFNGDAEEGESLGQVPGVGVQIAKARVEESLENLFPQRLANAICSRYSLSRGTTTRGQLPSVK